MQRLLTVLIILLSAVSVLHAQKVGLVLSGGGAKGLAHIGVIRALEENGIPIDYIAGTSMGAIVGGLYAAGFSTSEMETLFRSEQFRFWSTGFIPEENRYYFTKRDDSPAWIRVNLEKKDEKLKLRLPTNLVPEEQMDFAFMELFSSSNAVCKNDFNRLFVPFLCIATDVYNSVELELREGDLGEAIRASMTFPLYFKPIVVNGSLAFDGGILNNFPAENLIKAFNPDIVIGHSVANNPRKPDEDDVMAQLENMIMKKTNYEIAEDKGLLIETKFTDIGLLDFDKIDMISQAGYASTLEIADSIKSRIQRRVSRHEVQRKREAFNREKPALFFENIQVEGVDDPLQRRFIIQSLKKHSRTIAADELKKSYFLLVTNPLIRSMRPVSRYNEETGYFDLSLKVKKEKPLEVQIGGSLSSKPISQGFAGLTYQAFKNRLYTLSSNVYFGRFYSSLDFGGKITFPAKLPFYLSGNFTFNRWDYYASSNDFLFEDVLPPYIIRDEKNMRLEMGWPVGSRGKWFVAGSFSDAKDEYYMSESVKKTDVADRTWFDAFAGKLRYEQNSFNYRQFPTSGNESFVELNWISGKEEYKPGSVASVYLQTTKASDSFYLLKAHYDKYFQIHRRFSVGLLGEGVYSNKKVMSNYRSTMLGLPAFEPIPFSRTQFLPEFRSAKYLGGGLKLSWRLKGDLHLRVEGYGFSPLQTTGQKEHYQAEYQNRPFSDFKFMGLGGLVYHTGLGPVVLAVNYFDNPETKVHAVLGFGYILFNKKGY